MDLGFVLWSQREVSTVEGRSRPGSPEHHLPCCLQCTQHAPQSSAEMLLHAPSPCPGKVLLGTWPGARFARILLAQLQTSILRSSQSCLRLWSSCEVQVVQALSVHWETIRSCSGPRTHSCALGRTAFPSLASMRTWRKLLMCVKQAFKQKLCSMKCRLSCIKPAGRVRAFLSKVRAVLPTAPGQRCFLHTEEAPGDQAGE